MPGPEARSMKKPPIETRPARRGVLVLAVLLAGCSPVLTSQGSRASRSSW
jgi:hypothetical protein